jgi:hypothetical protein
MVVTRDDGQLRLSERSGRAPNNIQDISSYTELRGASRRRAAIIPSVAQPLA